MDGRSLLVGDADGDVVVDLDDGDELDDDVGDDPSSLD